MKIAMIGQKGVPARSGGIERHVEELSVELVKRGHEVLVFCRSWYATRPPACPSKLQRSGVIPLGRSPTGETLEKGDTYKGVRLIMTPSLKSKHLDAITHTLVSIIAAAREKVDVFHIHGVGPALLAWLPKLLRPTAKVVVTFHCIDRHHQKWNGMARAMLHLGEWIACRVPDATISVSKALQTYCRLSYSADTMYIPNGTQIPMHAADASELGKFGLEPNRYIMFCARLVKHKGAHTLIEAWKVLRGSGLVARSSGPDFKLAIVGGSAFTDAYVDELKQLAKNDPSIVLTGVQTGETLHALFANSYAVVHPSESEGLPIAVLEAMSYGKCVLSSDIPENLELTAEHGMSFKTGNVKDLAEHITMLLDHPDLVKAVGTDAREHVAKHYDWKDIADMTSSLYEVLWMEPETKLKTA